METLKQILTKDGKLYRTAKATIACAKFPANVFVSVQWWAKGSNGVNWYRIDSTEHGRLDSPVLYPEHHLTNFVL